MNEAVFMIAEASDRPHALALAKRALSALLSGLTGPAVTMNCGGL